jgi:hypothetical protein
MQKFRQHRQRTKQNRQSPIAGDHTAIAHSSSIPVPIPVGPKTVIHGRCSMEGLNSEIQGLVVIDGDDSVFKPPVSIELPVMWPSEHILLIFAISLFSINHNSKELFPPF